MAKKKKQKEPEGAPAWMVTYGDMMTLLLCFFVMIVAMSEIKEEEKYRIVVASLQKVFGYSGGIGDVRSEEPVKMSTRMKDHETMNDKGSQVHGASPDKIVLGLDQEVQTVREGPDLKVGASVPFDAGSATLSPEAWGTLTDIADTIRGTRYKVEVRGHTSTSPLPGGSGHRSHMELSVQRASVVRDWLVGLAPDRGRLDPRRVRVVGCGTTEPLKRPAYDNQDTLQNDRADIIQTHALIQEFKGRAGSAGSWQDSDAQF